MIRSVLYCFVNSVCAVLGFVPYRPCTLWKRSQGDHTTHLNVLDALVLLAWDKIAPLGRSPFAFS